MVPWTAPKILTDINLTFDRAPKNKAPTGPAGFFLTTIQLFVIPVDPNTSEGPKPPKSNPTRTSTSRVGTDHTDLILRATVGGPPWRCVPAFPRATGCCPTNCGPTNCGPTGHGGRTAGHRGGSEASVPVGKPRIPSGKLTYSYWKWP